jgi:ATP-dependent helicase/nuclease subunit A
MTREEIAGFAPAALAGITGEALIIVQGKADLVIEYPDGAALVVDFKTDRRASPAELRTRYEAQLSLYGELVRRSLHPKSARWAIYSFSGAILVGPFPT